MKKLIAFLLSLFSPHNESKYLLAVGVLIVAGFGFAGLSLCKKDPAWIALVAPCVALVAVVSSNYQANKSRLQEELLKAENLLKETYKIVVDDLRRAVSPHEWLYVLGVCHVLGDIKNRLDSRNVSYLEQKLRLYADKWLILLNEEKPPGLYYGLKDTKNKYNLDRSDKLDCIRKKRLLTLKS